MTYYKHIYESPIGKIFLIADENFLVKSEFVDDDFFISSSDYNDIVKNAINWLDSYFKGETSNLNIPINIMGFEASDFQKKVYKYLSLIPYGKTITYGEIADKIAKEIGIKKMSSQAVGTALKKNPLEIFLPCHRVVGSNNKLGGYAKGKERKLYLLKLERINTDIFK